MSDSDEDGETVEPGDPDEPDAVLGEGFECANCQRGRCARCRDAACSCCYGGDPAPWP